MKTYWLHEKEQAPVLAMLKKYFRRPSQLHHFELKTSTYARNKNYTRAWLVKAAGVDVKGSKALLKAIRKAGFESYVTEAGYLMRLTGR